MERVEQSQAPRPGVIAVDNETESSATRTTVDGRCITYRMKVLQQPARARACGQGAKSSADRRPVDPPPIIELNIFEGENTENDITFTMHANYFLFAELEHARPMATGRLPAERDVNPVLTGTPVAGLVYLDRPKQAGYFIFPDLSVRHEGKYRLSFSLYEELKDAKDNDKSDGFMPCDTDSCVMHRLEVKSEPFHVYSAKKFPGLTESTSLSRMVAEQGCRVRIRRDVRMRRRDTKAGSKDWDDYEEETLQARARMSATPDPGLFQHAGPPLHGFIEQIPRPRSASNTSHHSLATSSSRRPSVQDTGVTFAHPQYMPSSHTPQPMYPQAAAPFVPLPPPPPQSFPEGPFAQQAQALQAPAAAPAAAAPPPAPQHHQPQQQQPQPYQQGFSNGLPLPSPPPGPVQSFSVYPPLPPGHTTAGQSGPQPYANAMAPAPEAVPPQQPQQLQSVEYSSAPMVQSYSRGSAPMAAPPMIPAAPLAYPRQSQPQPPTYAYPGQGDSYGRTQTPNPSHSASRPSGTVASVSLPPLDTYMTSGTKFEPSLVGSASSREPSSATTAEVSHKRSFGHVFNTRFQDEPLRQGARPSSSSHSSKHSQPSSRSHMPSRSPSRSLSHHQALSNQSQFMSAGDDDHASAEPDMDLAQLPMNYRRADGRRIFRALPGARELQT